MIEMTVIKNIKKKYIFSGRAVMTFFYCRISPELHCYFTVEVTAEMSRRKGKPKQSFVIHWINFFSFFGGEISAQTRNAFLFVGFSALSFHSKPVDFNRCSPRSCKKFCSSSLAVDTCLLKIKRRGDRK